ncbi:MAG: tRNA 4-thiouridine(8) synthase ThiI [Pseudomonadota bacterium]
MADDEKKVRALGLCSGGLDSILSALVLRDQGIDVTWVSFETPFFSADKARRASSRYDIPLKVRDITPDYLELLKAPPAGFGKNMNPCMDCHSLMFRLAGEEMDRGNFHFLFSGEVAGQRPMSQTKPSLRYVEKHSGCNGYIIRPLSARLLPETEPEKKGWVDRERLLNISGRSRKPQIELARRYGVTDYPAPAGGCLLTDVGYSVRLKDLMSRAQDMTVRALNLLKYGRHLRLNASTKLIVGRKQAENDAIQQLVDPLADVIFHTRQFPGPLAVIPGGGDAAMLPLAAGICAGYGKAPAGKPVDVTVSSPSGTAVISVVPVPSAENRDRII